MFSSLNTKQTSFLSVLSAMFPALDRQQFHMYINLCMSPFSLLEEMFSSFETFKTLKEASLRNNGIENGMVVRCGLKWQRQSVEKAWTVKGILRKNAPSSETPLDNASSSLAKLQFGKVANYIFILKNSSVRLSDSWNVSLWGTLVSGLKKGSSIEKHTLECDRAKISTADRTFALSNYF